MRGNRDIFSGKSIHRETISRKDIGLVNTE